MRNIDPNKTDLVLATRPLAILPVQPGFAGGLRDPVADMLAQTKSPKTRRAYSDNVKAFFRAEFGQDPAAPLTRAFLALHPTDIAARLTAHTNAMTAAGRAASSINLRLAALRALIDLAHKNGLCATSGKGLVQSRKAVPYRDTRGPNVAIVKRLLALPDRSTLRGTRDFALLMLLANNGLRRFEVCGVSFQHLDVTGSRLSILGKWRDDREWVTLKPRTLAAIREYLAAAGHTEGAVFRNCASRPAVKGAALTEDGLDDIVRKYGKAISIPNLSCHKLRHFAITALLDLTNGNMRDVQKFSRHKDINVLGIYDDNRTDKQGSMTQLLEDLLEEE